MNRPASTDQPAALRYTLPAPSGSIWLGLGWISLAGLTTTLTLTVLLLLAGAPLALVLPMTAIGGTLSALPVSGRPLLAWIPTYLGQQLAHLRGADRWSRPLPSALTASSTGHAITPSGMRTAGRVQGRRQGIRLGIGPRQLRLTALQASSPGTETAEPEERHCAPDSELGLISHDGAALGRQPSRGAGQQTFVLDVLGLGRFGLLDAPDQDTELARWGTCLATLCADPAITSVQWISHARPDTGRRHHPDLVVSEHHAGRDPISSDTVAPNATLVRDYGQLVDQCAENATRHRHLVAVTLRPTSQDRDGGHENDPRLRAVQDIATTLLAADLLARPLNAGELGDSIRFLLDPAVAPHSPRRDPASIRDAGNGSHEHEDPDGRFGDPTRWMPLSSRNNWDHCSTDDSLHRCFVIAGWPRLALSADWLSPLLHDSPPPGSSRTLTVHARPVAPEHATRRARAASTKARLDAHDRSRLGFTATPGMNDTQAESDALAAEAELLAGYRMTDLSGLLTVSSVSHRQLDLACRQLRATATAHRLELRPLHGQHLSALASSLPLGLHPGARS